MLLPLRLGQCFIIHDWQYVGLYPVLLQPEQGAFFLWNPAHNEQLIPQGAMEIGSN
jgi:hypothetical protein